MENSPVKTSRWITVCCAAALLGGGAYYFSNTDNAAIGIAHAAEGKAIAAPIAKITEPAGQQVAVFAGGCFWGVEGVYEHVAGVIRVESGYAGGSKSDADYDRVSDGQTKHAEAVRIVYDPARVSYDTLLHIFFSVAHNPTELNRQGPDTGPQYRSAIFPENAGQRTAAAAYIQQLDKAKSWRQPIVTRIENGAFYPAEDYHQDYMVKNPNSGYIVRFDVPKVQALKQLFPNIYRGK
ncbi:MAG: peptide-methionine (S)-S-oxide reductase MsrA [Sphingorhabdus sp.]